jgi:uncharacterized membrane-anchored protein YitT (DUF2179 family)
MYSNQNKKIIFTVITRRELATLKAMIQMIDPDAFLTVMNTAEILGEGFKPLKEVES